MVGGMHNDGIRPNGSFGRIKAKSAADHLYDMFKG